MLYYSGIKQFQFQEPDQDYKIIPNFLALLCRQISKLRYNPNERMPLVHTIIEKTRKLTTWKSQLIPGTILDVNLAVAIFFIDLLVGIAGFMWLEQFVLIDAFYQTVITISTVGFTEVKRLDDQGKIFVSFYILFNIGVFAYILSVFSYYIIQGEIFKTMHLNYVKSSIESLSNHVIVCGFGKYGREITKHFLQHKIPFVVIDINPERIESIQGSESDILYIQDDATHDEALIAAGVGRARSLIAALPEDSDNVFIVLTARQLNPQLDIISRAKDPKSQKKLALAGANHVVMPEQIGGFYMATLVSKPGAVEFFSFITNEHSSDIGFEELAYENVPASCQGRKLGELHIRQNTGANIIGFRDAVGYYHINPGPDTVLSPQTSFIVLGDKRQLNKLKDYLNTFYI